MHSQSANAPVIHAIAVRLPVLPPVVKTPCGQFLFVDQYRDQLTEDTAGITCVACLDSIMPSERTALPGQ
jgi:hypothetical protein